jgi:hypothetical protein
MRLFASLKMICAAALLAAGFCSCASTETHNISADSDAAYREYINRTNEEHGLNL